jgi:crotonobetainyl-CoA:carnitine CoA-transferase CaiB-like acyl-CoA transferase
MTADLLAGVRVLETGSLLCVDILGGILAGMGADVVKVEAPGRGDYLRDMLGQIVPHHSPAHVQANAGKRSVTLDVRNDTGRDLFWQLLDTADVFITGNVADTSDRMGIGYEAQRSRKPSIVFCQFTGFGAVGPYAGIPTHGYSMNALAADWPMSMGADGFLHPDRPDAAVPRLGMDATNIGAIWSALAVVAALHHVQRGGAGTMIDTSGADAVLFGSSFSDAFTLNADLLESGARIGAVGDDDGWPTDPRHGTFVTADGQVVLLSVAAPRRWAAFCEAIGRQELAAAAPTTDDVAAIVGTRSLDDWVELASAAGFACTPVRRTLADVRTDPQIAARGLFAEAEHPIAGPFVHVLAPATIDGSGAAIPTPAPTLGEHTDVVLGELGLDGQRLAALRSEGVI